MRTVLEKVFHQSSNGCMAISLWVPGKDAQLLGL